MTASASQTIHDLAFVRSHYIEMMFYPQAWQSAPGSSPTWTGVEFPPKPRKLIPHKPGVYAFVVTPNLFDLEQASALFYIGKATNLYNRIGAYLGEIDGNFKKTDRPLVWKMINQWNGYLKYFYTVTATVAEAESLEDEMLNAFRPPFNKDYEAEVSKVMRAM